MAYPPQCCGVVCIIHLYYISVLYICIIYLYYTPVLYICIIHMYYISALYICIIYLHYTSVLYIGGAHLPIPLLKCTPETSALGYHE